MKNYTFEERVVAATITLAFLPILAVLLLPFYMIVFTGDFVGASMAYGIEEDSIIWTPFYNLHDFFVKLLG